jgi:succinate-semialdehyde dehydrogenase/glutarate-semialdehyde dehydrogenase
METHDSEFPCREALIGGKWIAAEDGARFEVVDPADGSAIAQIADCSAKDAEAAVAAARTAFLVWRTTAPAERSRLLRRWFDLIIGRKNDLAALLAREQGKPMAEARDEIAYGAAFVEWFAEEAR